MTGDSRPTTPTLRSHELAELDVELESAALWPEHHVAVRDALASGNTVGFIAGSAGSGWSRAVDLVIQRWVRVLELPVVGLAPGFAAGNLTIPCLSPDVALTRPIPRGCLIVWCESNLASDEQVDAVRERVDQAGGKLLLVSAAQLGTRPA